MICIRLTLHTLLTVAIQFTGEFVRTKLLRLYLTENACIGTVTGVLFLTGYSIHRAKSLLQPLRRLEHVPFR